MSATKKEDNQFLNETKLLVRNDRTPKKNKALEKLNTNVSPVDDETTLAFKKENSLRLLNDRIAQRADNPTGDFITKSYYDPERDELLKEYNSQYPSSFEYTDEHGNKRYRKFLLPEFDVELDNTIPVPPKRSYIKRETDDVLRRLKSNKDYLERVIENEDKLKNSPQLTLIQKAKIGVLLYNIERRKAFLLKEIAEDELKFNALQRRADLERQEQNDIERQNAIIRENNKAKVKEYGNTLNLMNKGKMNTEQQPNETDEEYLNRLRRNAEIEVPTEQVEDMKFITNQRFRKNMKTLLRNDVLIEQVMNSLTNTEKNDINKRMPLFKTEFEKNFGVNNKLLDITDILNFIKKFFENILPKSESRSENTQYEEEKAEFPDEADRERLERGRRLFENRQRRRARRNEEEEKEGEREPEFYDANEPIEEPEFYDANEPIQEPEDERDFIRRLNEHLEEPEFYDTNEFIDEPIAQRIHEEEQPIHVNAAQLPVNNENKEPFVYNFGGMPIYIFIVRRQQRNVTYKILTSESGHIGSYRETKQNDGDFNHMLFQQLFRDFHVSSPSLLAQAIVRRNPNCLLNYEDCILPASNRRGLIGYGIKSDIKNRKYGQLGRYKVNLQSLYHKNFFKLYTQNGDKVGKRGVYVSDLFVRLICQLVEGKKPSQEDISLLPVNELHLFNWTIQTCGLKSKHSPASLKYTVNELKSRLQLLEGEVAVGNNNSEILKEIVNILYHLKDFGVITPKKIKEYLSQFELY